MRTAARKHTRVLMLLAIAAGLAGLVAYYASPGKKASPGEEARPTPTGESMMTNAVIARIAAESRGTLREPAIQAAPRSSGAPPAAKRTVRDSRPSPPDGYSFVSYHGEMPRGRVEGEVDAGGEGFGPDLNWLGSTTSIEMLVTQAVADGRDWSFGWIRLAEGARPNDLARALQGSGAEIIGSSGSLMRARLPGDEARLQEIAALPEVDGLGAVPRERKLAEAFASEALEALPHEQTPVFITLMTDDPAGQWRQALEDLGVVVGRFDPDIRVYTANVAYGALETIAAADFVLAIEPIGIIKPAHDTSVPAMGADALRRYDGSPGLFSGVGGASVPIAVMDTGLNINHLDIASNRQSICGANFAWDSFFSSPLGESEDLWIDEGGHGTHVTGTIVGNGYVEPRFAGMAPSVRHIRFARVLPAFGFGSGDSVLRGMDFLAEPSGCAEAGGPPARVKPLIVNMSLSSAARVFEGRGVGERKLDSIVWGHRQLYVVAQANANIHGFSNFGTAKNSLAVGAALDSGDIAAFSSHGPTADGRLAPQIVATGVGLYSAKGSGSRGEYFLASGTSMASPSVAGVAALLMDAVPGHREQPALTRARLMASAIKPDAWLENTAGFPANNSNGPGALQAQYGLGKTSARTSVLNRDRADGWISGGAISELRDGEYAYQDIVIPEGASRLDVVMTWDEPPTDTIGSAVLNDLDLWLDRDGDCGSTTCREQVSASRVDNVEWVIVRNPPPGSYRAKVVAHRVYTSSPRAALAWTVIRGASTPSLRIDADKDILEGDQEHELTLTLTADEYVAAGTRLHIDCRAPAYSSGCNDIRIEDTMDVSREDGVSVDLSNELDSLVPLGWPPATKISPIPLGSSIPLGEIAVGETQEIKFFVSYSGEANAVRLYFTASAWNATAASASVGVRTGGADRFEISERPANDDFSAATVIEGERGSRPVDLLLATPEPGEPLFTPLRGRPAGSVWYAWTAPANGPVRFDAPPSADSQDVRNDRLDIFQGDRISALEQIASDLWGTIFFAEKGQSYRIRVSNFARGAALNLRWSQGSRPANDDFAQATVLEGAGGVVEGSSQGATLEPGEWFGFAAATTWYRWTAPSDGQWTFSSEDPRRVLIFEGDSIPALRLVSGFPGSSGSFPAGGGKEYRIVVAEPSAYASSGPYELSWNPLETALDPSNDHIVDAEPIESVPSSEHFIGVDLNSTVEPGEPLESGVRTKWWVWEAPEDGRYTWRLEDSETYPKLRVTVFTGTPMEDLQLVAAAGPDAAPFDFVLQAAGGQRYWIAAGFPTGDITAYTQLAASASVIWGPTPSNDNLAGAAELVGAAGSISASNRFATTERSERTVGLGHSSLWWTYEAPASGWYRFWLDDFFFFAPWVLAVYKEAGAGFGSLEFVRSSHQPEGIESDAIEVIFHAEAGARYTIRLGTRAAAPFGFARLVDTRTAGEFTIRWSESEAPVWLKYVGRLADGDLDASGNSVELRGLSSLALNGRGTALYVASTLGMQVFERDAETGDLTFVQLLEDDDLEDSSLIWDAHRAKLYAHRCGAWHKFAPVDETHRELRDEGTLPVTGPPGSTNCNVDVFMDSGGSFIHTVDPMSGQLQVLAFGTPSDLRHVQTLEVPGLKRALISNGDSHVYAATNRSLIVFERDAETGWLTETGKNDEGLWDLEAIVISIDDRYLFAFDGNGKRTTVFQLEDAPSNPQFLDTLPPFWNEPFWNLDNQCGFASARRGAPAVDVFCTNMAFGVRWQPETAYLAATDHVAPWQPDRFNNQLPEFGHTRNLVASPDGRHAYLDTGDGGLLVFERVGVGAADRNDAYAPLGILSVSPGKVTFGPISIDGGGCIGLEDAVIDDTHYAAVNSKWQTRASSDAEWTDLRGTETTGEVCAYSPSRAGDYRLVVEIRINGELGRYSSNTIRW